jgi:hypothetical protein
MDVARQFIEQFNILGEIGDDPVRVLVGIQQILHIPALDEGGQGVLARTHVALTGAFARALGLGQRLREDFADAGETIGGDQANAILRRLQPAIGEQLPDERARHLLFVGEIARRESFLDAFIAVLSTGIAVLERLHEQIPQFLTPKNRAIVGVRSVETLVEGADALRVICGEHPLLPRWSGSGASGSWSIRQGYVFGILARDCARIPGAWTRERFQSSGSIRLPLCRHCEE